MKFQVLPKNDDRSVFTDVRNDAANVECIWSTLLLPWTAFVKGGFFNPASLPGYCKLSVSTRLYAYECVKDVRCVFN